VSEAQRQTYLHNPLDGSVFVASYVNYSELFPHARIIIHHGGMGTLARAIRAGVPMLIVPLVNDQHRNAEVVRRLGLGRVSAVEDYTPEHLIAELTLLLQDSSYRDRIEQLARITREEDGAATACDLIEQRFAGATTPRADSARSRSLP
jgi:UDP:flavonoid glycosyltransferase YjiC (YdhE family)